MRHAFRSNPVSARLQKGTVHRFQVARDQRPRFGGFAICSARGRQDNNVVAVAVSDEPIFRFLEFHPQAAQPFFEHAARIGSGRQLAIDICANEFNRPQVRNPGGPSRRAARIADINQARIAHRLDRNAREEKVRRSLLPDRA